MRCWDERDVVYVDRINVTRLVHVVCCNSVSANGVSAVSVSSLDQSSKKTATSYGHIEV
jgi:hypothetical protein